MSGRGWLALTLLPVLPTLLIGAATVPTSSSANLLGTVAAGPVPGIPAIVLDAYNRAAASTERVAPGCRGVRWAVLAGIGKVESDHLNGRRILASGEVRPPYLGPRLDGSGIGGNTTPIRDTDNGRYDHDTRYDRAVGLMQFIPSTWHHSGGSLGYGRDGNGDGIADPNNVYDSTLSAVVHLCGSKSVDLTDHAQLSKALRRYNDSGSYVRKVLEHIHRYDKLAPSTATPPASSLGDDHLTPRMRMVRDLIRQRFGVPYGIGCYRSKGGGEHPRGRACDFMLSSGGRLPIQDEKARGDAIASYAQANAHQLGIYYIIWQQRIWNIERTREGWRLMENRGSATQNHFDHVHISIGS